MRSRRGFTLVELTIVILVIAILATIVTLGLNRYLADGRDNRRVANVTTVAEALEKYYNQNGEYPSCSAITDTGTNVASNVLKGIDQSALLVPDAAGTSTTNSIKCGTTLTTSSNPDFIEYKGDGSTDCSGSGSCLSYTLRYKSELDNKVNELNSRHTQDIATSGTITNLKAVPNGFKGINLTWATIQNATGYTLQRALDSAFTNGLVATSQPTNSAAVTGLVPGTTYYFRVQPVGTGQTGQWSNTATSAPLKLGTPSVTATTNSTTQITTNWSTVANADGATVYTVQRATDSAFTANVVTVSNVNATSYASTGLAIGQTYYFRVQATTTDDTSNWSSTVSATTVPPVPTGVALVVNSATQYTISWNASTGATSYRVSYGATATADTYSVTTSSTSIAISANILQGTLQYFKVYAAASGVESAASSTVSGTTPINAPGAYNMSGSTDGAAAYGSSPVTCPTGTTADFYWNANGGFWVQGQQYRSVGYSLGYGQGVTIQVATRCVKGAVQSGWTWSSNSYSYTRPGMNFSLSLGPDDCVGGYCGRVVNANWNNVCGTGSATINAHQMSAYDSWTSKGSNYDSIHWKGASSPGVWVYYDSVNIGCTASSGAIQVPSAYKCNGCS